jgi:hypothetical protein
MKYNPSLKREEVLDLLKEARGSERMEKEVAISWDSRNLIIRIPKEIADLLKIDKENRFKKNFKFVIDEKDGRKFQFFDITNRTKQIKRK